MEAEKIAGYIALAWLFASVLLAARLVRRGRALVETLARRYPAVYESLGRPLPGFLFSARRNSFTLFMLHRKYENLDDPVLAARFEAYRKAEGRLLLILLGSLAAVALLIIAVYPEAADPDGAEIMRRLFSSDS